MRKPILFLFLLFSLASSISAQKNLKIDSIPEDLQSFLELRDQIADSPEGGATVFIVAMILYTQDKELGLRALTIALDRSELVEGAVYKGFKPYHSINYHLERLSRKPYMARAYFLGSGPDNGYALPASPYELEYTRNRYSKQRNGDIKVFVKCTGGGSPRPATVRQNNRGVWKVKNYSSLVLDPAPPKKAINDDL